MTLVDGDALGVAQLSMDGTIIIGADLDDGSLHAPFQGAIDEVQVYDRALGDQELDLL